MSDAAGERPQQPSLIWINQFALLPSDGGGTRHFELGRELVRRGWKVTVLAADFHLHKREYLRRRDPHDKTPVVESVDGVEFRWLWTAAYSRNDWRRAWNWLTFARSVGSAGKELPRPSLVIGSSPQLFAARAGRHLARRFGVPFVFEVRDLWPESLVAAGSGGKGVAYKVLDRIARNLYDAADRILVLTRGNQDYLVKRGYPPEKFIYVPNGVDLSGLSLPEERSDSSELVLVYAGAHGLANGLDRLLDAAELLGPDSGVRFVLVGDGPLKAELKADAERRKIHTVEFRDPVPKPELMKLLSRADGGLMLLRDAELFAFGVSPNKLFDYFGAGLPVVCNVPGEVAGMVADAGAGVQAKDSTAAALAEAVLNLKHIAPEARSRMGRAGRSWVEREHSRSVLGERLDHALRPLASGVCRPS